MARSASRPTRAYASPARSPASRAMWRARPSACSPAATALGALIGHITGGHLEAGSGSFQPMNINYGLLPPVEVARHDENGKRLPHKVRGKAKKLAMGERALVDLAGWLEPAPEPAA